MHLKKAVMCFAIAIIMFAAIIAAPSRNEVNDIAVEAALKIERERDTDFTGDQIRAIMRGFQTGAIILIILEGITGTIAAIAAMWYVDKFENNYLRKN